MNSIQLTGRICHTPELKNTANGKVVINFTLAVDRQFRNADGEKEADFINCQLWDKSAEFLANYCHKGDKVAIVGRLQMRNYTDKDNNKRTIAEVIGTSIESLESKSNRDEKPDAGNEYKAAAKSEADAAPVLPDISDPFEDV